MKTINARPYIPILEGPIDVDYLFYGEQLRKWNKKKTPENWARVIIAYENSETAMATKTCENVISPGFLYQSPS